VKINFSIEINQILIFKHTNGRFTISLTAAERDEYFLLPNGTVTQRLTDPSYEVGDEETFTSLKVAFNYLANWLAFEQPEQRSKP